MALLVGALAVGVLAGRTLLRPLRYRHLAPPRVQWLPALAVGVALAAVADRLDGDTAVAVAILAQALLVAGVVANGALVGTGVLAVGLALNLASLAVSGGVPVRPGALVAAGVLEADEVAGASTHGPRHLEDDDERLGWLGDALPVEPLHAVVSFGDLIAVVGLADIAGHAVRRRRRQPDGSVVIDLRGHVRSDEEVDARLRHPAAHALTLNY